MKNIKKPQSFIILIFLFGLFGAGCGLLPSTRIEPGRTTLVPSSVTMTTYLLPENLGTPTVTSNPTVTFTPQETTFTITPSPSLDLPTITSLPTLQAAEAEKTILDLLLYNGGCDFPCWWGIRLGETSLQTSRSLLETFEAISITNIFDKDGGYARWFITENDLILDINASVVTDRETISTVNGLWITTQVKRRLDGGGFEVVWENLLNNRYLQAYMLPQILTTYGQPNDVLVQVNRGWQNFELILDYAAQGFAIWYVAPLERVGDTYLGCMAKAYTHLALWNPDLEYTWAEGTTRTTSGEEWEIDALNKVFLSLEEVTSLSLGEFYQTFKNPENTSCLKTPAELWPGP